MAMSVLSSISSYCSACICCRSCLMNPSRWSKRKTTFHCPQFIAVMLSCNTVASDTQMKYGT